MPEKRRAGAKAIEQIEKDVEVFADMDKVVGFWIMQNSLNETFVSETFALLEKLIAQDIFPSVMFKENKIFQ